MLKKILPVILSTFALGACSKSEPSQAKNPGPKQVIIAPAEPTSPPVLTPMVPPSWEENTAQGHHWSDITLQIIRDYGAPLYNSFEDKALFCPNFDQLTSSQKENFWMSLISELSFYESGHNPLDRYPEVTQGIDAITGKPVFSEGLLQLSYQDQQRYSFCSVFDWSADAGLDALDPDRTILSPQNNLLCGVRILIEHVASWGRITSNGIYWSVLRPDDIHSKVSEIARVTRNLSFCQAGATDN